MNRPNPALIAALLWAITSSAATAGSWQVCKLTLSVQGHVTGQTQRIEGTVMSVTAKPADADCPMQGEQISFLPETADYQLPLRRKHWPAVGTTVKWRSIYLDGTCKNDGDPKACRIKHFPVGW